jgi:methanogenic corrinoid protein MtbC1
VRTLSSLKRGSLVDAIVQIREQEVLVLVDDLLANGAEPAAVVEMCREAMTLIGKRFEAGEAFIPELIMAGEIMKSIAEKVKPLLKDADSNSSLGSVVIGTVKGDVHDIGKDIVVSILDAAGFEVTDLGVDVPAERFVEEIGKRPFCTVALSCLLTTGFDSMKSTVAAIEQAGLRARAKLMIGGAPITEQVCRYAAADGWGNDAASALNLAKQWAEAPGD